MKKNILAVIILAATLINLTLTAVMLFVFVPTVKQTNNLITKVAQIIDLELEEESIKNDIVDVANIEEYDIADELTINLAQSPDGKGHMAKIKCTLSVNKKADDYKSILELIPKCESRIKEVITDEVSTLTFETFSSTIEKNSVKEKILERIQTEILNSECVMSITFEKWVAQ